MRRVWCGSRRRPPRRPSAGAGKAAKSAYWIGGQGQDSVTSTPETAPYGSWRSPISTEVVLSGALRLGHIGLDGDSLYWVEGRPAEQGRQALVRRDPDGSVTDVVPGSVNVRSRVHEYGGGAYAVNDGGARA